MRFPESQKDLQEICKNHMTVLTRYQNSGTNCEKTCYVVSVDMYLQPFLHSVGYINGSKEIMTKQLE